MGAAALAITACSSEDNIVSNNQPQNAEVKTYTISIPADFSSSAQTRAVDFDNSGATPTAITSFATTDKIYVYKKSPTTSWLSWNAVNSNYDYLSPSQNGASCTLTGDITGQFAVGDVLELYYNMNVLYSNTDYCRFHFVNQDGTASGVADFAIATVKVKSIDAGNITFCQETNDTDETAHFENLSSMFRFKFTDGSNPITVKRLDVRSVNDALLVAYFPMKDYKCDPFNMQQAIHVTLATPTSDYIYAGIGIDESSDNANPMYFEVEGADGKVYYGSKAAPTGGFKKGKYYYSTSATTLEHQYTIQYPTITWTTPSTGVEPNFGRYLFDVNNFDFTISGTSSFARFYMGASATTNGTIRLNGLTATYDETNYINNHGGDLTLDITGDNNITCKNVENCIISFSGNLKLSGNGTLTVTAKNNQACGLRGNNNYTNANNDNTTTTELDVSAALAAPGYKVTRSARTDNGDDTYTWTYTVAPTGVLNGKFTINASGDQVYFSQGNLQATYDGTSWSWGFATNQWDYIGGRSEGGSETQTGNNFISGNGTVSANGTVDLFGWSTATTMYGINSQNDKSFYAGDFVDWGATIGMGWRTLTSDEWNYIFSTRTTGGTVGTTSQARCTLATINTNTTPVTGVIIFPDGVDFAASEFSVLSNVNGASEWGTQCTTAEWTALAAKGCVFLPITGYRKVAEVKAGSTHGNYWSSTLKDDENAYDATFFSEYYPTGSAYGPRSHGRSVRLVRAAE